jgi:hypothetical protein
MPPPTYCRASGNEKEIWHEEVGKACEKRGLGEIRVGGTRPNQAQPTCPMRPDSWRTSGCQIGRYVRTYMPYFRAGTLGCCRLVGRHSTCCAGRDWSPRMVTNI